MNLAALLRGQTTRPVVGRTRHTLTFSDGPQRRVVQSLDALHYSDAGEMTEIDTAWLQTGQTVQLASAGFGATASLDLQAATVLSLERFGQPLTFKPLPLYYANVLSDALDPRTMQRLVSPQRVTASFNDDLLTWANAYGPGTTLEWRALPTGVQKWLTIDSPSRFPTPLIPGPRALLVPFAVTMPTLRTKLKGSLLDISNIEVDEAGVRLETEDGEAIFGLERPYAVDSAGAVLEGKLKFRRVGTLGGTSGSLIIAASFPLAWFASPERVYPVRLDPTVSYEMLDGSDIVSASPTAIAGNNFIGTHSSTLSDHWLTLRWPDTQVPKGATIDDDRISVVLNAFSSAVNLLTMEVLAHNADDSPQTTTVTDLRGRPLTVVGADWTLPNFDTGVRRESPNAKAAFQQVVNRAGWVQGAASMTYLRDKLRDNTTVINRATVRGPATGTGNRPQRSITYTPPPPGTQTTIERTLADGSQDAVAYGTTYTSTGTSLFIGSSSTTVIDTQTAVRWTGLGLPQGSIIQEARLELAYASSSAFVSANNLTFETHLDPAVSPTMPTTAADLLGRARTVAKSERVFTALPTAGEYVPFDLTAALQEQVNKGAIDTILTLQRDKDRSGALNGRLLWRSFENTANLPPRLIITYTVPSTPSSSEVTVTLRPRAGGDDGRSHVTDTGSVFSAGAATLLVNDISTIAYDYQSFVLLTLDAGQVLPQGVTLVKAEAYFTPSGGASNPHNSRIAFQLADNPTAPTTVADQAGRTRGAYTTFDPQPDWVAESVRVCDVTAAVQTIVNRAGYSSGRMLLLWDFMQAGYNGSSNNHQAHSYDADPAKAVRLVVKFLDPSPPVLASVIIPR